MKIEIDRNQNKNYVSISMKEEQIYEHEKNMLSYNEVPSILPVSMRYVDELVRVEYDIAGMQQISVAFLNKKLDRERIVSLINALSEIQENLIEYMLSPDGMLLDPNYIFTDMSCNNLFIRYLPGERERVEKNIQPLLQYILENVDYNDQASVKLAYALYHINDETGDIISTMKKCILESEPHALAIRPIHVDDGDVSENRDDHLALTKQKKGFFYKLFNRDSKREVLLNHAPFDEDELEEN